MYWHTRKKNCYSKTKTNWQLWAELEPSSTMPNFHIRAVFFVMDRIILHIILKVNKLNLSHSILYKYSISIWHMFISYAPPTTASLLWFYYSERCFWAHVHDSNGRQGCMQKRVALERIILESSPVASRTKALREREIIGQPSFRRVVRSLPNTKKVICYRSDPRHRCWQYAL